MPDGGKDAMKLWDKGNPLSAAVCAFTAGEDYLLDRRLVKYDCIASIAHARTLARAGMLTASQAKTLEKELSSIISLDAAGKFTVDAGDEDCHTAIENHLTKKLGATGKMIHAGRSRNDQVLSAMRLYCQNELSCVKRKVLALRAALTTLSKKEGAIRMPGYTHTRKAMPSSVGIWAGCFVDALSDSWRMLRLAGKLLDRCPLGTAAGYGSPVELDRKYTAELLGFGEVQSNPLYAQNGRGKLEGFVIHCLAQVMLDLNRMANDIILFSTTEFGYFVLPDELCTGSSIMPQKKNPDVLELVRARYHVVTSLESRVLGITGNLLSGYNRDLQLTKGPVMEAFDITGACLDMMSLVISGMSVDGKRCSAAMTDELFAAHRAHELAKTGVPFRDAYRAEGKRYA